MPSRGNALRSAHENANLCGLKRQPSNADAILLEHNEAALVEHVGELRKVRQQQRDTKSAR
jgi:hypothetical protein